MINLAVKDHEDRDKDVIKISIPKGYEFTGVANQQVVFEKIGCKYPKTYEECCDVLNIPNDERYVDIDVPLDYNKLLSTFTKLLICRKAYWKLAGEHMGLGKPWEPDFTNNDEERYSIYTLANRVKKDFCGVGDVNTILCFPTEEMRDAFHENFWVLIEFCKELL